MVVVLKPPFRQAPHLGASGDICTWGGEREGSEKGRKGREMGSEGWEMKAREFGRRERKRGGRRGWETKRNAG